MQKDFKIQDDHVTPAIYMKNKPPSKPGLKCHFVI